MLAAFLPIEVAGTPLLLDAGVVREVVGSSPVVRVPHATLRLPGVFSWRGLAIPLIDTAAAMGLVREQKEPPRRTVIAHIGMETVGLSADDVREVALLDKGELRPNQTLDNPFAVAEVERSGRLVSVIDLDALLTSVFATVSRDP